MPTVKNEVVLAQKYIDKIPLDKIRDLVSTGAVPPPEALKWEKWVALQDSMEVLRCQSGRCKGHEVRRWKWQGPVRAMHNVKTARL